VNGPHGATDEGSKRKTFARYWLHGRFLLVNNRKMAKRDGTFFTLKDLLDPRGQKREELAVGLEKLGFTGGSVQANALRFALISNQYTQPMNFTLEALAAAKNSVDRLQNRYERLREIAADAEEVASDAVLALVSKAEQEFDDALNDNLNTPNALASVFKAVGELNQMQLGPAEAREALRLMESFDEVLDVLDRSERGGLITGSEVDDWLEAGKPKKKAAHLNHWSEAADREQLWEKIESGQLPDFEDLAPVETMDGAMVGLFVAVRQQARKSKDFRLADAVRDDLKRRGIALEDTLQGFRWARA
jgi:cysteinyl-tRNA synthetase